jgi:hypothetical protein
MVKLVMPGLVPGIHVLAAFKQERRGWPGRSLAMTVVRFICSLSLYAAEAGTACRPARERQLTIPCYAFESIEGAPFEGVMRQGHHGGKLAT